MYPIEKSCQIPVDAYLDYALSLTPKETELIKDFSEWLPNEIIDAHAHSNTKKQCKFLDKSFLPRISSTFPWFEVSKHLKVNRLLYPKKKIKILLFPFTHRGIDHRTANDYIVHQATENSWIIPILYGLPDDTEYTIFKLRTQKFYGLKMYPAYFFPPAQKIREYFPDQILKYCENLGYPIILHLPFPRTIMECKKEVIAITRKFPNLRIVLAHMGLAFFPRKHLKKIFSALIKYGNIYLDTAMVTSPEVFKIAFDALGYNKIIFGTDQPLNLIRAKRIRNTPPISGKGTRIVTEYPYHWVNFKGQKECLRHGIGTIHFHWEILLALRKAIRAYGENKDIKNCIFRENAKRVFGLR